MIMSVPLSFLTWVCEGQGVDGDGVFISALDDANASNIACLHYYEYAGDLYVDVGTAYALSVCEIV